MSDKPTYEELEQQIRALKQAEIRRKKAEKALKVSEERFRAIFEQAAVGVAQIVSKTGDFVLINQRYADIVGYTIEEMHHLSFQEITHPDDLHKDLDNMKRLLDGEIHEFSMEKRYYHKNGSIVWVNLTVFPMRRIGEAPNCHVAVAVDITKRKLAEELLRKSEVKYKDLYDNAVDMLFSIEAETAIILDCNQTMVNELGYNTKEEIIGRSVFDMYTPDSAEYAKANVFPIFVKTGRVEGEKLQLQRKDDSKIDVKLNATAVYDKKGSILYSRSTWRDITKRNRAEKALISEKLLSEEYINSLPGLFYVFDEQRFVKWNREWNMISGYSDEELASMYGTDFFEGKDKVLIEKRMLKTFAEGAADAEAEFITKDGQRIPYYFTGLRKELNGKNHLIGLGIDITVRKQAEGEKRKALEFAAEQSRHALIGQVAGKMAHDFNNVLMGIMGNAQLATMDCDDEELKVMLENINEFALRGKDITSNLMAYSKDQEPKQTYFKIEDKIDLVLKMLEKDLTGIKVSRNYKPGTTELLADPGMIQDALVNIIQNSIHAMSKVENPTLNLKAYSQDDMVYIEVEDNGCGIPKEHLDSIYTPSFTLKGSHDGTGSYQSNIKGTGYGMSNVKKYIVEKHRGDILVESEVGQGTMITIALRIIKDHLSSAEKKEIVKSQIYDKRRILLVEDEPAIADVQYQLLTKEPFNHIVSIAANGQIAIDTFDRNKFDVISLDYVLPGNINGLDVYHHIRENNKDIPVMFISGNIEFLESMKRLKEKDPNLEYLSKPIDNLDYVNKINELVGSGT